MSKTQQMEGEAPHACWEGNPVENGYPSNSYLYDELF
jgi:hypothetical protein